MAGSKISALTALAAIADDDLFPIVDTSATMLKKMTRAQLRKLIADSPTDLAILRYSTGSADWVVTTPSAMITGLAAITTLAGADVLPINQSTTGSKVTVTQLRAQLPLASPADGDMIRYNSATATWEACTPSGLRWRTVLSTRYTAALPGSCVITMSDTSDMVVGYPVKYSRTAASSTYYYGLVTSVTANTSITVHGYLLTSGTLATLFVGTPEMVITEHYFVSGAYGDGTTSTLLATDMNQYRVWNAGNARAVTYYVKHTTDAGATQPAITPMLNGTALSTTGVAVPAAGWQPLAPADITSDGAITRGQSIELRCATAGSPTSGAQNLSVAVTFVLE